MEALLTLTWWLGICTYAVHTVGASFGSCTYNKLHNLLDIRYCFVHSIFLGGEIKSAFFANAQKLKVAHYNRNTPTFLHISTFLPSSAVEPFVEKPCHFATRATLFLLFLLVLSPSPSFYTYVLPGVLVVYSKNKSLLWSVCLSFPIHFSSKVERGSTALRKHVSSSPGAVGVSVGRLQVAGRGNQGPEERHQAGRRQGGGGLQRGQARRPAEGEGQGRHFLRQV